MTSVPGIPRRAGVRLAIRRPFAATALIVALFALVSCDAFLGLPKARSDADGSTGSLVVSFGEPRASARTVTADFTGLVSAWTIALSRADGATRTVTASGATVTVNGLVPGSWNIAVTGRNAAGATLFAGSVAGVAITASGSVPVTVPVTAVSPDNGTLRLTVTVPYYANIGSATATVDPGSASPVTATVTVTVDDVALTRTIRIEASLPKGAHTLAYRLFRGPAQNTPAGTFVEAVNIYPGIVSDRWIADDGTLSTVRALGWGDLVSTDRQLSDVTLIATQACFGGNAGFEPGTTFPLVQNVFSGTFPVDLRPVEAVAGQTLSYSTASDSGPWMSILSGNPVPVNAPGNTVWFRVISPNGDPDWNNVYQIDVQNNNIWYHSTPNDISQTFIAPYTLRTFAWTGWPLVTVFNCWNTAIDGSGTPYPEGYIFNTAMNLELYAQWQTPATTAALAAISTQLTALNGNVVIPAGFTANDLYALAAVISGSTVAVMLDMSAATGITLIPVSAFIGCVPLTTARLPPSITSIGSRAFEGTNMVTAGPEGFDFICEAEVPPELGAGAFGPVGSMAAGFGIFVPPVPVTIETDYESAAGWSNLAARISHY